MLALSTDRTVLKRYRRRIDTTMPSSVSQRHIICSVTVVECFHDVYPNYGQCAS